MPPFIPELTSDGDDIYFPRPTVSPGSMAAIDSDTEDDSDSESFKMIQVGRAR